MKKLILLLLFIPLVSFGQMDYYVSAKGGLNVREQPNSNSKKVAALIYRQKVTIESKTGVKLTINDTDKETGVTKAIEGEWVEITSEEKIRGYVFDGFLKGVKSGTDFYTLTIEGNSKIYDYNSYKIITTDYSHITGYPDSMGEQIKIYSKDDESVEFTIGDENNEVLFGGIVQGFMIIEDGSMFVGPEWFSVYDLQNQKIVFDGAHYYPAGYQILNSKIEFYQVIDSPNNSYYAKRYGKFTKPKCSEKIRGVHPESIGYTEKFIYDIATQQLERTGVYDCAYFQ